MAKSYLESLLGEQEKIILVSRQHGFILGSAIFIEITLILIILAVTVVAAISFQPLTAIVVAIGFIVLLLPVISMVRDILIWSNRQYIVTNRRVMQISGVINKNVIDSSLEKVNDVKMEQSAFGRVFDYGDVEILTASELGVNLFSRIENPIRFKTAMLNAKEQLEHGMDPGARLGNIPAMIAKLGELRQQGIITEQEFQSKKTELLEKM